jgi:hypothetical protein
MGSLHGLSAVHIAREPVGTFNVQRSTLNGQPSIINLLTINRFMGSLHGLSAVHIAREPVGTFNVQRSTFNVQRSTFNAQRSTLNGQPSIINLLTINRFMGSLHGLPAVQNAHRPSGSPASMPAREPHRDGHLPARMPALPEGAGSWEAP